jgi:hypothetical protein
MGFLKNILLWQIMETMKDYKRLVGLKVLLDIKSLSVVSMNHAPLVSLR